MAWSGGRWVGFEFECLRNWAGDGRRWRHAVGELRGGSSKSGCPGPGAWDFLFFIFAKNSGPFVLQDLPQSLSVASPIKF